MPTFLETLAERDRVAEETQHLLLTREAQYLEQLKARGEAEQLLEDAWDTQDPFVGNRAVPAGLGSAANDLYHPGAIHAHTAMPGSRRHGAMPPFYRTEPEHRAFRDAARVLEAFCPTAVCILDVLSQFVIFTGFQYQVIQRGDDGDGSTDSTDKAQEFIDKWQRDVDWYSWELELFHRSRRDGEAFLILEEDDTLGTLSLRSVEPEQVKEPANPESIGGRVGAPDDASWRFGILTEKEDTSIPLGYWVVSQFNESTLTGQFYEPDEVFHIKTEWIDRQSKRGISDFFSVANDLPGVKKLLRNLREGATVQAAIAWVREHQEGMMPNPMGASTGGNVSRTGQTTRHVHYDGPTMLDVTAGLKYTAGPLAGVGQSETLIQVLQAALRNIGARWQMPEGVVSGDASNANLASALVAEGPFTRALEARQWFYRNAYKRLLERVLDHAAVAGMLGPSRENILDELEIAVEMPPVIARKQKEDTERDAILSEHGILSNQSWAARADLDFENEKKNIEEDPIQPLSFEITGEGIEGGEPEDDTQDQTSTSQDDDSTGATSGGRRRAGGLSTRGARKTTQATGTNKEREGERVS
jgi:hypothetical protein